VPPYAPYLAQLRAKAVQAGLSIRTYGEVLEDGERYPLLCLERPGTPEVVITAGFHGEEPAGPLSVEARLLELAAHAAKRNVGLRVYPCLNPSGFERKSRYNASGERPNNDLLRYEVSPGLIVGELENGGPFLRFMPYVHGPKETRALLADLEARPTPVSALDIHQDNYLPGAFTYAYIFGDRAPYRALAQAAAKRVPVAGRTLVDDTHKTDDDGLVEFHDGSVTDYFWRRGALFASALETTTSTPLEDCHSVNLLWMCGFVDLAAGSR
jgi:hypothetical protein